MADSVTRMIQALLNNRHGVDPILKGEKFDDSPTMLQKLNNIYAFGQTDANPHTIIPPSIVEQLMNPGKSMHSFPVDIAPPGDPDDQILNPPFINMYKAKDGAA